MRTVFGSQNPPSFAWGLDSICIDDSNWFQLGWTDVVKTWFVFAIYTTVPETLAVVEVGGTFMVYFENCFLVPEFIPIGMGFRFHLCTVPDLNKVPAGVNRSSEDPVCTCNLYHCSFLLSEPTLQAKRNPRVLESVSDASKLYPHHLVLLSEGFMEGRMALRSAVVTSNVVAPPGVSAKLEQTIPTTSQAPAISGRSSSVNASKITIVALFMLCMLRIFVGILFGFLQQYPKLC